MSDTSEENGPESSTEWRRLRMRLLRRCGLWGTVLSLLAFVLSIIYAESYEQRIIIGALAVAAGFFGVAAGVGPMQGFATALFILISALIGPIVFSCAIGFTVAIIGVAKLQRLKEKMKK
jgi:hypothetical protein